MKIEKLNESYSAIESDSDVIQRIKDFLKVENKNAMFSKASRYGFIDRYTRFYKQLNNKQLVVYNGHLGLRKGFGVTAHEEHSEVTENEVDDYIKSVNLPFTPYDYQINNIKLALMNNKMIFKSCTSSGKSLSISLILNFFMMKGYRGVLIVPNVNLLTQFLSDIKSYGLTELANNTQLLGDGNTSDFSTSLTITTWQSMTKEVGNLDKLNLDFIICDEVHRMASECTSDIISKSVKTRIKLGFTGTLPEDLVAKMTLIGLFGIPKTIITASQLIDRGLGTPVFIKTLILDYSPEDKQKFRCLEGYQDQLKFIKEHEKRTDIIAKIALGMREEGKNTLILYQHTEHGKHIYSEIFRRLFEENEPSEKELTGKNAFEFQKQHNLFFMNGEVKGHVREKQRNLLEEDFFEIELEDNSSITLNENQDVLLKDGRTVKAKELTEEDEISDEWIKQAKVSLCL